MHRFFVPPERVQGNRVILTGEQAHHIRRVLRLRPGNLIVVLDNSGWEQEVRLTSVDRGEVRGEVLRRRLAAGETRIKVSLYQAVLKGARFEYALEKGTELGIVEFVPLITDRCVVADLDAVDKKQLRWERIVRSAAQQSRRGQLPRLQQPLLFRLACERAKRTAGLSIIPCTNEPTTSLRGLLEGLDKRPFSVNVFVGPEGGFTEHEVELAQSYDISPVNLGPRIFRAETAGLVVTSALLYALDELE
jgi:16S rRNA (uracil1498-N3)-methyltransferase